MKRISLFCLIFAAFLPFFSVRAQTVVAPRLTCVVNNFSSGNVDITWQSQTNSCGAFVSYEIFRCNASGTCSSIATIANQAQTTYTDVGAATGTCSYYMVANYSCGAGATVLHSDTIRNESNPQVPAI